jgi:nicotinamidase-related amidase
MPDLARRGIEMGRRPALILVDLILGFTDGRCPLGTDCPEVVAANARLLAAFRAARLPVFFTTVIYRDVAQARVFRARIEALNLLTPESPWVEVDPRLARQDGEVLIEKQWASAFFATDLAGQLRAAGVDSLMVTGLTTSGCVRATAVDGLQHDYPVWVVREGVGDRNPAAHAANLHDLHAKYADVIGLDEALRAVADRSAAAVPDNFDGTNKLLQ